MNARPLPILVALLLGAVCCTSAAKAEDEAPSYTMADVTACSGDAMRLCRSNMPSIKAIEDCMRANFDKLKPKCQARFRGR